MKTKKENTRIASDIIEGLQEFVEALESGDDLGEKFTCYRLKLDLKPQPYTPEKIKRTRELLNASQALFAKFLGVSPKTVRQWEQGLGLPSNIACRFMDEIRQDPQHYLTRLRELLTPKNDKSKATN